MITGTEKRRSAHVFFLLPLGSLVWSNTHPRNAITMRLLSLADKSETVGMNEERGARKEKGEGNE